MDYFVIHEPSTMQLSYALTSAVKINGGREFNLDACASYTMHYKLHGMV